MKLFFPFTIAYDFNSIFLYLSFVVTFSQLDKLKRLMETPDIGDVKFPSSSKATSLMPEVVDSPETQLISGEHFYENLL